MMESVVVATLNIVSKMSQLIQRFAIALNAKHIPARINGSGCGCVRQAELHKRNTLNVYSDRRFWERINHKFCSNCATTLCAEATVGNFYQ